MAASDHPAPQPAPDGEPTREPPQLEARTDHEKFARDERRVSEERLVRNAGIYLIEREAILLRRRRWREVGAPAAAADRPPPARAAGDRVPDPAVLHAYERPDEPSEPRGRKRSVRERLNAWVRNVVVGGRADDASE